MMPVKLVAHSLCVKWCRLSDLNGRIRGKCQLCKNVRVSLFFRSVKSEPVGELILKN
jgi:hypothetical protein